MSKQCAMPAARATKSLREMVWRRMQCAGVQLNGANAMIVELVCNWASPAGAVGFALLT